MTHAPVYRRLWAGWIAAILMLAAAGAGEAGPSAGPGVPVAQASLSSVSSQPAPAAPAATLHDQLAAAAVGVAAQNFENSFNAFDSRAADDFTVPGNVASWEISGVDLGGQYLGGAQANVTSVTVWFYADDGNDRPGNLAYTGTFVPGGAATGNYTLTLNPVARLAGGGHFWMAIQANKDFSTGQWVWLEHSGAQNGAPSLWQNPGGGYQTPCNQWGPRAACFGSVANPDLAFRLLGDTSANNPPPILTSLSPAIGALRDLTLAVNGVNFVSGATLQFKVGVTTYQLSTTVTSGTLLTAELTAGMLSQVGETAEVTVTNPGTCGGSCVSNTLAFGIMVPVYLPIVLR